MCVAGCKPSTPPRNDCHVDDTTKKCSNPAPWGCCFLATHKECAYPGSDKSQFTCIDGYWRQYWQCTQGTKQRYCAECIKKTGTSCWDGEPGTADFQCSIWWEK